MEPIEAIFVITLMYGAGIAGYYYGVGLGRQLEWRLCTAQFIKQYSKICKTCKTKVAVKKVFPKQ